MDFQITMMGIIVTFVVSIFGSTGAILAMMFWCRQEANTLRSEAKDDRRELMQISRNLEMAVNAIQVEMKDFHNRLLQVEKEK
jgi:hypothetical protein